MKQAIALAVLLCLTLLGCDKPCKKGYQRYGVKCVKSLEKEAGVDAIDGTPEMDASHGNFADASVGADADSANHCYRDQDGDGVGAGEPVPCESDVGTSDGGILVDSKGDCDDENDQRSPSLTDVCGDGIDNNCDGEVDPDVNNACGGPCGTLLNGTPGQPCTNGLIGECLRTGVYVCDGTMAVACSAPSASPTPETCNGKDDNCDGEADDGLTNACGGPCLTSLAHQPNEGCTNGQLGACLRSGKYVCSGPAQLTCDAPAVAAGTELCSDEADNDCDGQTNESDAADAQTWYADCDGDTFATSVGAVTACAKPSTTTCKAWLTIKPVPGSTLDCNDASEVYRPNWPANSYSFAIGSANGDLNCDGVIELMPIAPGSARVTVRHHPEGIQNQLGYTKLCSEADIGRINQMSCPAEMCASFGKTTVAGSGTASVSPPNLCVDNFPVLIVGPPPSGSVQCDTQYSHLNRGGIQCR